jgi:hypothetical protein
VAPELQHYDGNNVQARMVVRIAPYGTWDTALLGTAHGGTCCPGDRHEVSLAGDSPSLLVR